MSVLENRNSESSARWLPAGIIIGILVAIWFIGFVAPVNAGGAMQISGSGDVSGAGCDVAGMGADFALRLQGDLVGCQYVFVESGITSPSGTYREAGTEYYVIEGGRFGAGTFWTNYVFTGKFDNASGVEIFGRCQHPIQDGSGTGAFTGVRGRLDFKDFPEINYFPYRGHMQW